MGSWRLLLFVLLGGAALWALAAGRMKSSVAVAAIVTVIVVDLWSIDRRFYEFSPRAKELFADDAVTRHLRSVEPPYRVVDAGGSYGYAILMAYRIPDALGYHGFELRFYDELVGRSSGWSNISSPNLLDLLSIRFLIMPDTQSVPGYHLVVPPTATSFGSRAALYERDSIPPYARVVLSAVKVPADQTVPTVLDPRFPVSSVILLPDTSQAEVAALQQPFPESSARARVTEWAPGRMRIAVEGSEARPGHLLISENWYPDWHARVDGEPAAVRRADNALLSVDLPAGAREVALDFDSQTYSRGKLVSLVAVVVALVMLLAPLITGRSRLRASAS